MNEVIRNIKTRRSIRRYTDQVPSREIIDELLDCAIWAPSGSNAQLWHFTVITNKEFLEEIERRGKEAMYKYSEGNYKQMAASPSYRVLQGAPCLIVVSCIPEMKFGHHDAAYATQNICLAAHSMGLGTCIVGLLHHLMFHPEGQDIVERFHLPEHYVPSVCILLGYPKGEPPLPREKFYDKFNFID